MKKVLFAGLMLLFVLPGAFAQSKNKVVQDPVLHRQVLQGLCTRHGLETGIFSPWFNNEYKNYHPDAKTVESIAKKINKTNAL